MASVNPNSKKIKLKGTTFQSVANGTVNIEIQQPGDCNQLIGINIYDKTGSGTVGKTFSLTINSQLIIDNINAAECNPTVNFSNKPFLQVVYPLAGSDSIKLSWTDTVAASYVINIYYYY